MNIIIIWYVSGWVGVILMDIATARSLGWRWWGALDGDTFWLGFFYAMLGPLWLLVALKGLFQTDQSE